MKNDSIIEQKPLPRQKSDVPERILVLDSLRGIAALSTFFFHFREQTYFPRALHDAFGTGFGTSMSFVISGFIIPYVLWKSEYRIGDLGRFLFKRIVRIEPLYSLAIFITLFGVYLLTFSPRYTGPAFSVDWVRLLVNLTYLNAFTENAWYVHVGWILAVEIQFYIVIGLMFGVIASPQPIPRLLGWLSFLIVPLFFPTLLHSKMALLPGYSYYFAFGILAFQFYAGLIRRTEFFVLLSLMCAFIGLSYSASAVVVGLAIVIPVLFGGSREPLTGFIGRMSYSVFLFHLPIGLQLGPRLATYLGANGAIVFPILVTIVLFCCWILHHLAELPLQRVAQRIRYGKYRRRAEEALAKTSSASVGKRISKSFEALKMQVSDPVGEGGLIPTGSELSSRSHPPKR